jgi:beta-1,4-N-acetylglucosaminyltransferase
LEALGNNKPLIVVPNEDLMNNHQLQLAKALTATKYLLFSRVESLSDNIQDLISSLKSNPPPIYPKTESALFSNNVNKLVSQ